MFVITINDIPEDRSVFLFQSRSGRKYDFTVNLFNKDGRYTFSMCDNCFMCRNMGTWANVLFLNDDAAGDIDIMLNKDPDPLPIYSQSRKLELDDEPSGIKAVFEHAVRKLELD